MRHQHLAANGAGAVGAPEKPTDGEHPGAARLPANGASERATVPALGLVGIWGSTVCLKMEHGAQTWASLSATRVPSEHGEKHQRVP